MWRLAFVVARGFAIVRAGAIASSVSTVANTDACPVEVVGGATRR
jgi:hypothetical protein